MKYLIIFSLLISLSCSKEKIKLSQSDIIITIHQIRKKVDYLKSINSKNKQKCFNNLRIAKNYSKSVKSLYKKLDASNRMKFQIEKREISNFVTYLNKRCSFLQ